MRPITLPALACLAISAAAVGAEPISEQAVEHAITEYVHAKYAGDAGGVQERTHHAISRYMRTDRYFGQPSDEWLRRYHWDNLRFYATDANRTRHNNPTGD